MDMTNAVVPAHMEALECNDRKRRYKQNAISAFSSISGSESMDIRFNALSEFWITASSLS
jgi:hypothetical protein